MYQVVELILFPLTLAWGLFLDILCFPVVGFLWVKDKCRELFKRVCWQLSYKAHERGWRHWEFKLRRWAGRKMTMGEYFAALRAAMADCNGRMVPMGSRTDRSYYIHRDGDGDYIRPHNLVALYLGSKPSPERGNTYREREFLLPLVGHDMWNALITAWWGGQWSRDERVRLIISVYCKLATLDRRRKCGRV